MEDGDKIKNSFQKVKQDMDLLIQEIEFLKIEVNKTNEKMMEICEIIKQIIEKITEKTQKITPTDKLLISANPTHSPTDNLYFKPLKDQNLIISTGNQGVPTDRQTNQQTNQQTENNLKNPENRDKNTLDHALDLLNSLDNIKREIRLKFKKVTNQEMLVFSSIYQLEEEQGFSDYKTISKKLNLTESSIRDYVGRLIKKGIPVDKKRINNKNIQLSISKNLKRIASLNTILKLREL